MERIWEGNWSVLLVLRTHTGLGGMAESFDRIVGETYAHRRTEGRGLNGALAGCVPAILLPLREDELDVRVRSYKLGNECAGWHICDCLAMAEKLIPLLFLKGFALAFEFGEKGFAPEFDVWRVVEDAFHMICILET